VSARKSRIWVARIGEHHPNSLVTPTTRSSRLGRRGCETVKCDTCRIRWCPLCAVHHIYMISAAKGLFMANRLMPCALNLTPAPRASPQKLAAARASTQCR
jgi:hypothetical protein